jgi:hypothetical protein
MVVRAMLALAGALAMGIVMVAALAVWAYGMWKRS